MQSPWEVSKKVYIIGTGHMTKIADVLIYGKIPSIIFFSRTGSPMILKLCMQHQKLKLHKVYINDDPELTLTLFKTMSNFPKLIFVLSSSRY